MLLGLHRLVLFERNIVSESQSCFRGSLNDGNKDVLISRPAGFGMRVVDLS